MERPRRFLSSLFGSVEGGDSEVAAAKRKICFEDSGNLSNLLLLSSFAIFLSSDSFSK